MYAGSMLNIITNRGKHKGFISKVVEKINIVSYEGYIDGKHFFELIYVKKSDHYSGSVSWSNDLAKTLPYNSSFIENFTEKQEAC